MKSKEIQHKSEQSQQIDEGPLDFLGRVRAGIKGTVGTTSDFKTGYQQKAAEQNLRDHVAKTYPHWNQAIVNYKKQGITDPQLDQVMRDWATDYFGFQAPEISGVSNAQTARAYLEKLWAMKLSPTKAKQPAQQQQTTPQQATPQQTTPQQATPQQTTPQQTTPQQTTPQQAASQASADPFHDIFKDPEKFKTEWEKYAAGKGQYALITNPKLLSTLKTMWMRTGGLRTESVTSPKKGKRI